MMEEEWALAVEEEWMVVAGETMEEVWLGKKVTTQAGQALEIAIPVALAAADPLLVKIAAAAAADQTQLSVQEVRGLFFTFFICLL